MPQTNWAASSQLGVFDAQTSIYSHLAVIDNKDGWWLTILFTRVEELGGKINDFFSYNNFQCRELSAIVSHINK